MIYRVCQYVVKLFSVGVLSSPYDIVPVQELHGVSMTNVHPGQPRKGNDITTFIGVQERDASPIIIPVSSILQVSRGCHAYIYKVSRLLRLTPKTILMRENTSPR